MAHIKSIPKVKFLVGIMYKDKGDYEEVISILTDRFGEVQDRLEYDFDFTDYYEEETGKELKKLLLVFSRLIDRGELADIKHYTNSIEDKLSKEGKRKVNLDPGYMTEHNVVLASAKEMPHKIYIGQGMFGDVVLEYKNKAFQSSPHTFPDYRSDKVKEFLKSVREKYKKENRF